MPDRWYGAHEQWPAHPKQWWRDALAQARPAGWHLQVFAGHSWGKVVCSRAIDDPCAMLIFSTGRSGENHAKDLIGLIRRCRHPRDGQRPALAERIKDAGRVLDGAQLLLDAAESCLAADSDTAAAEDLLEMAQGNVTAVENLLVPDADGPLDRAIELERRAQAELTDAHARAAAARYPAGQPVAARNLTDEAEERIEVAATTVDQGLGMTGVEDLRGRIQGLRDRVDVVRSRLTERSAE